MVSAWAFLATVIGLVSPICSLAHASSLVAVVHFAEFNDLSFTRGRNLEFLILGNNTTGDGAYVTYSSSSAAAIPLNPRPGRGPAIRCTGCSLLHTLSLSLNFSFSYRFERRDRVCGNVGRGFGIALSLLLSLSLTLSPWPRFITSPRLALHTPLCLNGLPTLLTRGPRR